MTITTELAQRMREAAKQSADAHRDLVGMEVATESFDFIQLATPVNVLALLDALEAKDAHEHGNVHYVDAAELEIATLRQRIDELEARTEQQPVAWTDQRNLDAADGPGTARMWGNRFCEGGEIALYTAAPAAPPVSLRWRWSDGGENWTYAEASRMPEFVAAGFTKNNGVEIEYLYAELSAPAAQPVTVKLPELSDAQCLDFLSIASRHAHIVGDIQFDDIRIGLKMAFGEAVSNKGAGINGEGEDS